MARPPVAPVAHEIDQLAVYPPAAPSTPALLGEAAPGNAASATVARSGNFLGSPRNQRQMLARAVVFGVVGGGVAAAAFGKEAARKGALVGAVAGASPLGSMLVDGMWTRAEGPVADLFRDTIYPAFGA